MTSLFLCLCEDLTCGVVESKEKRSGLKHRCHHCKIVMVTEVLRDTEAHKHTEVTIMSQMSNNNNKIKRLCLMSNTTVSPCVLATALAKVKWCDVVYLVSPGVLSQPCSPLFKRQINK